MQRMTLDEKIGQLNLLTADMAITGPTMRKNYLSDIRTGRCGALLNAYTPSFVRSIQQVAVQQTRLHIPLMFGFDVIHGHKTIFPVPLAMACSWDTAAIQQAARIAADEASADGLNWVYSPMVDITRDPRWGRVVEGAGEDPWLGSCIARAYVKGYQGTDLAGDSTVMACVKHFALYGAVEAGRDYNIVDMSRRRMLEDYLPTYRAAVEAGAGSVMTSFNEINGVPATANRWLLTDLLRHQWHFKGFVVTDYNAVSELINHGVAADKAEATLKALHAGADMDMMGMAYIQTLPQLVRSGKVPVAWVDRSVRRVLEAKYKLGLFQDPYRYCDSARAARVIMSPGNLAFARQIARESIVLLKNKPWNSGTPLLPLQARGRIAVIGPMADDQRDMIGPWSGAGDWHQATSILQGIRDAVGTRAEILYAKGANITDDTAMRRQLNNWGADIPVSAVSADSLISQALDLARKADVVILALGESEGMTGEAASRADIHLPACQRRLMRAVYRLGKPVVLVLSNGRPLVLRWENEHIPSILETWFLGTEAGHAIADVLFGAYNPSGRLSMSFPYATGQIPVYYAEKNTGRPRNPEVKYSSKYLDIPNAPLYPFGYGLSYTSFAYSDLSLEHRLYDSSSVIRGSFRLTNTGSLPGTETAQIYIRQLHGDVTHPLLQLRGLKRVSLQPGESRLLHFTLRPEDLKSYDLHMRWRLEPGPFDVFVGPNAADLKQVSFTVTP